MGIPSCLQQVGWLQRRCELRRLSTPWFIISGLDLYLFIFIFLVSREELENHFVRLQEENMHLKNHANKRDDEMKKLGTKLKKMANDQDRLAQLVLGRGQVRVVEQELDVMVEGLQQRLQALERQNEELKRREHTARQQGCLRNGGNSVCFRLQKLQNNVSPCYPNPAKNVRRLAGGKSPADLLEEARAEISSLKHKDMLQQNHIKEMKEALERLQKQLEEKEAEHKKKVLQIQQEEASKIWANVENNVTLTNLQEQIRDKSNTVAELQERFVQMQKSHRTLQANYQTAVMQMNDLLAQLNKEKEKSSQLEKQLQVPVMDTDRVHGLQQQLGQLKEERDMLRERISKWHRRPCDGCQAQKSQRQEQQLQVTQLQTALMAELVDKNVLLRKFKSEQEANQELAAEMRKLKRECQKKQQQLAELNGCSNNCAGEGEYHAGEFSEALLLLKRQKNRQEMEGQTGGAVEADDGAKAMQELQDAHRKTMRELQKSEKMLSVEREICKDFKLKLEEAASKMSQEQARARQRRRTQLLDARAAEISLLRCSGTTTYATRPQFPKVGGTDEECVHLGAGESLVHLQIVGARLSPPALQLLGESEPATFCTYIFFRFDIHSTPVVRGQQPEYSFTSKYVVKMEEDFLDYVSSCSVLVELHQRLAGCEWRTMATAHLPLRQLLEHDGKVQGSVPLFSVTDEAPGFGSLDYCIRLKPPVTREPPGRSPAGSAWARSWAAA